MRLGQRSFIPNRRKFLKVVGGAAGAVALGGGGLALLRPWRAEAQSIGGSLARFVDALPIPGVMSPSGTLDGVPLFKVAMRQFKQKLHRDLPRTTLWGYNGLYPGATFEARQGSPIAVRWTNC